ncbi:MAG: hypothetical protein QOF36_909 [Microbacteriaceae bacterium]|jgi:hypothetical protein|nr:hypothetical protein [Microbacteriaceae bacterium]
MRRDRACISELPASPLVGSIPVVFSPTTGLDEVPARYQAMADREAPNGAHRGPKLIFRIIR